MLPDLVFRLFACCIPVRGARRSALCDVQRGTYHLVPNGLYEIVTEHRDLTASQVVAHFGADAAPVIAEYYEFLVQNELGFWCDTPEAFPPLELSYQAPEAVTHAVVDVGPHSRHDFARIFAELDDLGCKALQLRFFRPVARDELWDMAGMVSAGKLRALEVLMPYAPHWTLDELERLVFAHQRVSRVTLHSAPEDASLRVRGLQVPVLHTPARITSASHCGQVHPGYFVVNLQAFTEAQAHNSCLNGKISVDEAGEIRNCPALPASFGNVADTSLHAALAASGFRDLWEISKDRVETCRDCEFRYVCTDCRAFVRAGGDRFAKPATCTYDPYTASWASAVEEMPTV